MDYFAEGIGSNKQVGTAGELLFIYESYRRGLFPCEPKGDPPCFDIIVTHRKTGKPMVVQTRTAMSRKCYKKQAPNWVGTRFQVKATCNGDTSHIRDTNVDILAVYCVPHCWYFLKAKDIKPNSVAFYPHMPHSKARYENKRFKENWGVFGFSSGDPVLLS